MTEAVCIRLGPKKWSFGPWTKSQFGNYERMQHDSAAPVTRCIKIVKDQLSGNVVADC